MFESLYDFDVLGPITADEGGTFTIASDGSFNTTLSLGLGIDGSLDDANFTVVGTLFENATDGTLTLNTSGTWTTQRDEPLPAPPPPALKWKRERLDVGHLWRPLTLNLDFVNPVVIAGPPTANEAEPGVIRVRQAQSDMPEVRFQEWSYLDGLHLTEDTAFAIFEAGREEMPDGSIWEVGTFPLGGTGNWQPEFFTQPFPEAPAVFLTVQTTRGTAPVTVRARDVTATGFDAALFEEESEMSSGHSVEEIGYLAVYSPRISGTVFLDDGISIRGFPYLLQMPEVDDRFVPVHAMSLRLEEEQSQDVEVRHTKESVAVLTLGPDVMFAQQVSSRGRDTTALRRLPSDRSLEWGTVDGVTDEWVTIPIRSKYSDAVVVAKPASFRGADPGVLQQRRGPGDDLQVRFKEWDYLDGSHGGERVFYLVAPAAGFSPGNLRLRAGKLDTSLLVNDGVETVTFPYNWSVVPALFTSVMTANDSDPVTTRVRNLSSSGFEIAMQEEEAKGDGHLPETLGWIAIEKGSTSGLKRNFTVLGGTVGDDPTRIPFSPVDRQFPVIIADVNSFRGFDPVTLRYRRLTQVSVDLLLQEEQSFDAETRHTSESVSIFVAE